MNAPIVIGGLAFLVLLALFGKSAEAGEKSPTTKTAAGEKVLKSPLASVTDAQWTAFVRAMATAPFSFESPKNFFGAFLFGIRRLADLGVVKNPRKVGTIWVGDWVKPKEVFLSSPALQYEVFGKSMKAYVSVIAKRYQSAIGTTINGKKVTLSGLLGAAHAAGGEGLGKWIGNVNDYQAKYKHVMERFSATTGIF